MRKLDVKEIHGYDAAKGLELLKPDALAKHTGQVGEDSMIDWFFSTLRQYPEIAIFLTLAIGYYFGKFTFKGIGLGAVTATLLAGVVIGQIGITISQPLKATVFLMFLFAVGYGVGPAVRPRRRQDGLPQALFAVVQCVLSLFIPFAIIKLAGYDLGYAAGLYAGSQTISAAMGLATDAINRLGLAARPEQGLLDAMPVAYAVTYMFGTVGSALVIALLGPALLRIDLPAACKDYEEKQGGTKEMGGAGSAWHRWEVRAFRVQPGGKAVGSGRRGRGAGARRARLRPAHPPQRDDRGGDRGHRAARGDVVAIAGPRGAREGDRASAKRSRTRSC
jgi:putative transport protein